MPKLGPHHFECTAVKSTVHTWVERDNGTGYCLKCNVELTVEQMAEVKYDPADTAGRRG